MPDDFEATGTAAGGDYASGGLERKRQGTWMGARRGRRGRAAVSAAAAGRVRG